MYAGPHNYEAGETGSPEDDPRLLAEPDIRDHLDVLGDQFELQLEALLAEERSAVSTVDPGNAEQASAEKAAGPETILEGRVVELSRRKRLGAFVSGKVAAMREPTTRVIREVGELASEARDAVLEKADGVMDGLESREEARRQAANALQADIQLQRRNGGGRFDKNSLLYELDTGNLSPRRVLPPPGIDTIEEWAEYLHQRKRGPAGPKYHKL